MKAANNFETNIMTTSNKNYISNQLIYIKTESVSGGEEIAQLDLHKMVLPVSEAHIMPFHFYQTVTGHFMHFVNRERHFEQINLYYRYFTAC